MLVKADLHIHSCLSPCGDLMMSPTVIVETAKERGLNLIAITDHNSCLNNKALYNLCKNDESISCLFGMEVTTEEEVHCLCLFDELDAALEYSDFIYKNLPKVINDPDKFGDQVYVDAQENILGEIDKYLNSPVSIPLDNILREVHDRGGLFIPAHVDRPAYSLSSQLGFIPDEDFDALEISKFHFYERVGLRKSDSKRQMMNIENYHNITNSDAHFIEDIGKVYNEFEVDDISISSLRKILYGYNSTMKINSDYE